MRNNFVKLYTDLGVHIVSEAAENAQAYCPFHNDVEKPSFSIQVNSGVYKCFVSTCPAFNGGNFNKFYEFKTGKKWEEILIVPEAEINKLHLALLGAKNALKWLHDSRGFTDETIQKYNLGWDGERICIPIYSGGICVNLRKHSTNKRTTAKVVSYKPGYGSLKLFPEQHLSEEKIAICEGELDAILLSQIGIPAISVTGGAGSWKNDFSEMLRGKEVAVVYDIDAPGRSGAAIVSDRLLGFAKVIKNVLLPITTPANGDITDYIVTYGKTKQEISDLIETTRSHSKPTPESEILAIPARETQLSDICKPEFMGHRIKFRGSVIGRDLTPYAALKKAELTCKFIGKFKYCTFCPLNAANGRMEFTTLDGSLEILKLLDSTDVQVKKFVGKITGIYSECNLWNLTPLEYHIVNDVQLTPEISYSSNTAVEYIVRQAFLIAHSVKVNVIYEFEGIATADPRTQYLTVVIPKAIPVRDNVASFMMTPEIHEQLKIFQRGELTVKEKMRDIAHDLSINVTHIYERENLIEAIDLCYHSVLCFNFQGRFLKKGWTEILIIGDTRTGKTETIVNLIEHYKAGEMVTGENASFAGLAGGLQQMGNRWQFTLGKLPMNDRRLIAFDEVSGITLDDIAKLSAVRSTGIVEVTKIQSEKAFARTRGIWSGNPRSPRPLSTYDTGVQAIKDLIGRPEDIARFDLAITVASGEVSVDTIHAHEQPHVEHKYTSSLCHDLIMWAWSRTEKQVFVTPAAEKLCLKVSAEMSAKYSSVIPLVEPAEQRVKIIRLAVACAARLFSTEDGETVIVKPEHVEYVHEFLELLYNVPSMNYGAFSKARLAEQKLKDENEVKEIIKLHGNNFVEGLLDHQYMRMSDLEDILDKDKKEVKQIIARLIRNRALKHYNTAYIKTPAFIQLLRSMQGENLTDPPKQAPDF